MRNIVVTVRKLNQSGFDHVFTAVACIVLCGVIGGALVVASHAATQWKGILEAYNQHSGYCVTTVNSSNVPSGSEGSYAVLTPCSKTKDNYQTWSLVDTRTIANIVDEGSSATNIQEFELQSAAGSNECLNDWQSNGLDNTQMRLYPCSTTATANAWIWETKIGGASPHQMMSLSASDISITGARSETKGKWPDNMCLDDNRGSHADDAKVDIYVCKTSTQSPDNQEWFEDPVP